jgi:hypothetical protein
MLSGFVSQRYKIPLCETKLILVDEFGAFVDLVCGIGRVGVCLGKQNNLNDEKEQQRVR